MLLHVDTKLGRATAAEPAVLRRVELVAGAHSRLPKPPRAGRRVGDRQP
jgi:carnitine 3-dehydrogenase